MVPENARVRRREPDSVALGYLIQYQWRQRRELCKDEDLGYVNRSGG